MGILRAGRLITVATVAELRGRARQRLRLHVRGKADATPFAQLHEVVEATAHDWLADEFAQGTWAIHRPGWYGTHYAEMRRPEGRVLLAGSDLAAGWAGFIDGAIESGLRAGAWVRGMA